MSIKDSSFFEQPLSFVDQIEEGKHIVLFYEEIEYANMISFQFIKSGLVNKKDCSYLSGEAAEAVKREMSDSSINVNKFTSSDLLHIYQVPSLGSYHPTNSQIADNGQRAGGNGIEETPQDNTRKNPSKIRQSERIVLRCGYNINNEEQMKSNLKWEYHYRLNLRDIGTTVVCTYPINEIIPTISESIGPYGKWMNTLLEMYDGVIFARRFWKGVAFNLA